MESYKEDLIINEASHRFLSPPWSTGPFSKWVASHELIQRSYYFKMDYIVLLFETASERKQELVASLIKLSCTKGQNKLNT